jgi:hypothetical protein
MAEQAENRAGETGGTELAEEPVVILESVKMESVKMEDSADCSGDEKNGDSEPCMEPDVILRSVKTEKDPADGCGEENGNSELFMEPLVILEAVKTEDLVSSCARVVSSSDICDQFVEVFEPLDR